jgi:hypothetical protein
MHTTFKQNLMILTLANDNVVVRRRRIERTGVFFG